MAYSANIRGILFNAAILLSLSTAVLYLFGLFSIKGYWAGWGLPRFLFGRDFVYVLTAGVTNTRFWVWVTGGALAVLLIYIANRIEKRCVYCLLRTRKRSKKSWSGRSAAWLLSKRKPKKAHKKPDPIVFTGVLALLSPLFFALILYTFYSGGKIKAKHERNRALSGQHHENLFTLQLGSKKQLRDLYLISCSSTHPICAGYIMKTNHVTLFNIEKLEGVEKKLPAPEINTQSSENVQRPN